MCCSWMKDILSAWTEVKNNGYRFTYFRVLCRAQWLFSENWLGMGFLQRGASFPEIRETSMKRITHGGYTVVESSRENFM